jgi:hypothetical protein
MRVQSSARVYQQRYDDALAPWDMRAPGPTLGEDITEYRCKLAILAKKQLPEGHQLRKVSYRRMDTEIFDKFEPDLLRAVQRAAYDASSVPPGHSREVVELDRNGMKLKKFVGQTHFIQLPNFGVRGDFYMHGGHRPGRRILSFNTSSGPMKCIAGGTTFFR